jgi:hypothetical protein
MLLVNGKAVRARQGVSPGKHPESYVVLTVMPGKTTAVRISDASFAKERKEVRNVAKK